MKKIMLSGGRPTGKLHLGHYVGAFKTFADLQENYNNYFIISDIHMLTTKATKKEIDTIFENSLNMIIDAIGMGIDPKKTTFYLQSQIPSLSHIYGIFQNYVKIDRVNNTPSLLEMSKHANQSEVSLGLVAYPVLEAADVFSLKADVVPVGKDNIDHIKITQEIITALNSEFYSNFKVPDYLTTENNHIVGTDGSNKMSKSLDNAIYVRDSREEVERKVMSMKWVNKGEEGINVVLEYIKIFDPELYGTVIYPAYLREELSEDKAKMILIAVLDNILKPMRQRMKPYLENKKLAFDLLVKGTARVKEIADESMLELRKAIGLVDLNEKQLQYTRKVK